MRVHQRHHRAVLPAVRPDDRRLDDHLGVQFADAEPGADGAAAAAARQGRNRQPLPLAGFRAGRRLAGWLGDCSGAAGWRSDLAGRQHGVSRLAARRRRIVLAAGALVGWLVGRAAQSAAGLAFPAVQRGVRLVTGTATPGMVGKLLRVSVLVLVVYGGLLWLTY